MKVEIDRQAYRVLAFKTTVEQTDQQRSVSNRWEDGKDVRKVLYGLDRWEAHAAHAVRVEAAGCTVTVRQEARTG